MSKEEQKESLEWLTSDKKEELMKEFDKLTNYCKQVDLFLANKIDKLPN